MSKRNLTLLTDLYELTMMQGYYEKGQNENVIFDVFFRQNPCNNGYSVCAGLDQVIDYIKNLHFRLFKRSWNLQRRFPSLSERLPLQR